MTDKTCMNRCWRLFFSSFSSPSFSSFSPSAPPSLFIFLHLFILIVFHWWSAMHSTAGDNVLAVNESIIYYINNSNSKRVLLLHCKKQYRWTNRERIYKKRSFVLIINRGKQIIYNNFKVSLFYTFNIVVMFMVMHCLFLLLIAETI